MEMQEQNLPIVFSQMLQMFPNIPHDVIWIYVERYSSDTEKCAQMLNLQNGIYTGLKPSLDNSKNLNEHSSSTQVPYMPSSEAVFNNNNVSHLTKQLPLINREVKNINSEGINENEQTEYSALNSQNLHPSSQLSSHKAMKVHESNVSIDYTNGMSNSVNFHEPLALHINVDDDDGSLHSWRPNLSADVLCSDFFLPSPMLENFQLSCNNISSLNFHCNTSEIQMNPEGVKQKPWECNTPMHNLYGYPPQNEKAYEIDITSHLHYQKSQINAIRYEVIKAKIRLSDLNETAEKLNFELKEKMQSKSVQDIEKLNGEIVQLRSQCQQLCIEVDYSLKDQVLLGEVDEKCYEENKPSSHNTEAEIPVTDQNAQSHIKNSADVHDESNRWQCAQCTFANHPAISICEMCYVPKPTTLNPPFLPATHNSCYCHPKEESLSVQS